MSPDVELVCMRLADMTRVHPRQIERPCSRCGAICGVYPSGQNVLRNHPLAKIVCQRCVDPAGDDFRADDYLAIKFAAPIRDLERERRESRNKT